MKGLVFVAISAALAGAAPPPPTVDELAWAAGFAKDVTRQCPNWQVREQDQLRGLALDEAMRGAVPGIRPSLWDGVLAAERDGADPDFCATPWARHPRAAPLGTRLLRPATAAERAQWVAPGPDRPSPSTMFTAASAPRSWAVGFAVMTVRLCPAWAYGDAPDTRAQLSLPPDNPVAQWKGGDAALRASHSGQLCADPARAAGEHAPLLVRLLRRAR